MTFAYALAQASGGASAALTTAVELGRQGLGALGLVYDDQTRLLRKRAVELNLCQPDGAPESARCAELVLVCDILAAVPDDPPPRPPRPSLVFTAPPGTVPGADRRLDLLIADIIRMARDEILIGGPFWNDAGFASVLEVLDPAVTVRNVRCTFYVHTSEDDAFLATIRDWVAVLPARHVRVRSYSGPVRSLMHAKFVAADRSRGYLGSANLTSLGFAQHVETGVELTGHQTAELIAFLDQLEQAGLFRDCPSRHTPHCEGPDRPEQ